MKLLLLVSLDAVSFCVSLFLTYIVYSNFNFHSVTLFLIKAYWNNIVFMGLYFLVILNFFGLYNLKNGVFHSLRTMSASLTFSGSLLILSFVYPSYQFSRFILFINLTILYFALSLSRTFSRQLLRA